MQTSTQNAACRRQALWALTLTASMLVLSGCVSAVPTAKDAASLSPTQTEAANADAAADGSVEDQQVVALGTNGQPTGDATATAMMPAGANGQPASLVLQTSGLRATSSSIYASQMTEQPAGQIPADAVAVGNPASSAANGEHASPLPILENQPGVQPATNSLFHNTQPATEPMPLPLEGASNKAMQVDAPAEQVTAATTILPESAAALEMPASVPLPLSAVAALQGGTTAKLQAVQPVEAAAGEAITTADVQQTASLPAPEKTGTEEKDIKPTFTLASLFAGKRKNKSAFDGDRFGKQATKKTVPRKEIQQQVASLSYNALPGVRTTSMFATVDDAEPAHDDASGTIEVASLPGLARLAPNGLWLQTGKVETGCFKPELMQVLRVVENHYGRKVMVTSGLRDLKHNRRAGGSRQSLHTSCEAADIQIPGIGKWALAEYLRTIPGRGGVGTYCHTESVHIDIGTARDWNWRCRRRKG